jgi:hypothetical protein
MDSTIETKPLSKIFVLKMTQTVLAIMFSCFLSNVIIIKTKVILPSRFLAIMFSCFLSNVIIIKTKVILPSRFWLLCFHVS